MTALPNEKPSPWRFAWIGLWILPLALTWDFFRFLSHYHHYHERALAGIEQLSTPLQPDEVIVVLTGDVGRIPRALELLKARGSSKLIISGAAKGVRLADMVNQQGASTANLTKIWKKIVVESQSGSTVENAIFTRAEFQDKLPSQLILLTSDYHMDRSLAVFRGVFPGVKITPFSVPSVWSGKDSFHFFWKTGAEYWKSLVYRLSSSCGF